MISNKKLVRVDGKFLARGDERLRVQGVTYGPFKPGARDEPFPEPDQVARDFARMRALGVNALRTYHVPPGWFLELAEHEQLAVFVDIPWASHLCFLDSDRLQKEARRRVRRAAQAGREHSCILSYSVGNEIPSGIIRWHGAKRVERFLAELMDVCKQADPDRLVTYASFPRTEYLDLSFFDFATFNVYLHELETFRKYLFRLQNLVGEKPLLLGEIGMDTKRQGELEQGKFLAGHFREAVLTGLCGGFIFSWTDEWHTGGHPITDWKFGITNADRSPKLACHKLGEVFHSSLSDLLPERPRVSVVVCTYNGGATLEQCLESLRKLDYPDYEVIVVDDGSTDDTPAIVARFPEVRGIRQENCGLSAARNVGLWQATGSVVAYTDADCFADPDWLSLLVYRLQLCGAVAVGGPNLTPPDGWMSACVAASPGQPTHVLENDQVAEHIPGCNMAFRREALVNINGFDPVYRKAGDDVDVCWRLQQTGAWITYSPGAFVWHHRRSGPLTYLRQQRGYGEAEALLRFKHPDRFNGRGDGKWRGVLYGASLRGLRLAGGIVYRGVFATGLFQCIYQPMPAHWVLFPSTLEWHVLAGLVALLSLAWPWSWVAALVMLSLSVASAGLQASQARLTREHNSRRSRFLIMALCYAQPLVRSWQRYQTRILSYSPPMPVPHVDKDRGKPLPWRGVRDCAYWSEEGYERTHLLGVLIAYLSEHRWGKTIDCGWSNWDVEVHCHPWTVVQVCTSQEQHGGNRRLIRVRYRLRFGPNSWTTAALGLVAAAMVSVFNVGAGLVIMAASAVGLFAAWWRGRYRAARAVGVVDALAEEANLVACVGGASKPPRRLATPRKSSWPGRRIRKWLRGSSRRPADMAPSSGSLSSHRNGTNGASNGAHPVFPKVEKGV